jgi:tetratricopeptide (TPR) repeat protein
MRQPGKPLRHLLLGLGVAAVAVAAGAAVWLATVRARSEPSRAARGAAASATAQFVGVKGCVSCHEKETALWRGSHHDLAMQEPTSKTVVADFDDATFTHFGVTSTFYRKGDRFFARTDGPDGLLHDYEIAYTFGVYPLQQLLIAFPGGRYQALNVCWDARPRGQGGQRWFHLYPDEPVPFDDILHWTGPYQNWNHMCAECHSTDVKKNYSPTTDTYATTFSEVNVSCEACHGPGSLHVAWAEERKKGRSGDQYPRMGLVISFREPTPVPWVFDPSTGIARRNTPRQSRAEVETCGRCHARRGSLAADYTFDKLLMDTHRPVLLEAQLYEDDGQIRDEVYEYQSFLQSKMYAAGVTCGDCHNAHSLKPAAGNVVCARCHQTAKYDTPRHHFHKAGTAGSGCRDCHMVTKNYMVVHARHDHSFRIPRPDLTRKIGTRDACSGCHGDHPLQWSIDAALKWWGPKKPNEPHYGEALHLGNHGLPGAVPALMALLDDPTKPGIVRGTAASLLGGASAPGLEAEMTRALQSADPWIRYGAVQAVRTMEPAARVRLLAPLLADPIRLVRVETGRALAAVPREYLTPDQLGVRDRVVEEWRQTQMVDADRAEAHLNLGAYDAEVKQLEDAEREYTRAIALSPRLPGGYVNLADLYREQQREDEAERVLRRGIAVAPRNADLPHALGLLLVRRKQLAEALPFLQEAAALAPDVARYGYVYAVALNSAGKVAKAIDVLQNLLERFPGDTDILAALAAYNGEAGNLPAALDYARKLVMVAPGDPGAKQLLSQLQAQAARLGPVRQR